MKRIFFIFTLFCSSAFAQDETQRIIDGIAPLLNENVILVGHADLDRIKPKTGLAEIEKLAGQQFGEKLETLRRAKIRDVYFLSHTTLLMRYPLMIAVPLADGADAETVEKAVRSIPPGNDAKFLEMKTVGRFLVVIPRFLTWDPNRTYVKVDDFAWQQIEAKAVPRPELTPVLQAMDGSAIRFAMVPPAYARRVLADEDQPLPVPFENLSLSFLAENISWVAFGIRTEKPGADLIVKTPQEQSARDLRISLEKSVDSVLRQSEQNIDLKLLVRIFESNQRDAAAYLKSFLPSVDGDTLKLTVDRKFIEDRLDVFAKIPEITKLLAINTVHLGECTNNLHQLTIALHNHYDTHFKLPPLYTVDKNGKPLHGWRVHILPYLGHGDFHKKIRLDEPWDSEYNRQFHDQCPPEFQCPTAVARNPEIRKKGLTTYSVIVGENAWPDGEKKYEFAMMRDGTSNTWAIVERKTPVCWMDPTQEITQEEAEKGISRSESGIGAPHAVGKRYGTNVAFFDGSVKFIAENLTLDSLRRFVRRNDGESNMEKYDDEPETKSE